MNDEIEKHGFAIYRNVVEPIRLLELIDLLGQVEGAGRRGLLGFKPIRELACSSKLLALVQAHLNSKAIPVRTIYFDKFLDKNWLVPWHQDLSIAVQQRIDVKGFGPWSVKDGIPHVQSPLEILMQMITVRIHLDDADESNGMWGGFKSLIRGHLH
jgi:hypothetical protein